jgi:hypothetical protein
MERERKKKGYRAEKKKRGEEKKKEKERGKQQEKQERAREHRLHQHIIASASMFSSVKRHA